MMIYMISKAGSGVEERLLTFADPAVRREVALAIQSAGRPGAGSAIVDGVTYHYWLDEMPAELLAECQQDEAWELEWRRVHPMSFGDLEPDPYDR